MSNNTQSNENETAESANEDRRAVLRKLGRYAYTAPVMLSLLVPNETSAQQFPSNTDGDGGGSSGGTP